MAMIRILRMRRHEARPDPDVVPYLKPLWACDGRVGVAAQEPLTLHLGARSNLPVELRFNASKGISQGTNRTWLAARVLQRRGQMSADRQSTHCLH